jgi:transcriptional regulator with XRE-family HTH domain
MFDVRTIGARLHALRVSTGMSQAALAARARVSPAYLSRVESGQAVPGLAMLERISQVLGVGLRRILMAESEPASILEDPFIRELAPLVKTLTAAQRETIIRRLRSCAATALSEGS